MDATREWIVAQIDFPQWYIVTRGYPREFGLAVKMPPLMYSNLPLRRVIVRGRERTRPNEETSYKPSRPEMGRHSSVSVYCEVLSDMSVAPYSYRPSHRAIRSRRGGAFISKWSACILAQVIKFFYSNFAPGVFGWTDQGPA